MEANKQTSAIVVFDLDDTLFKEVDYLYSAYKEIAAKIEEQIAVNIYQEMVDLYHKKQSVFDVIKAKYAFSYSIQDLVTIYRNVIPDLYLEEKTLQMLQFLHEHEFVLGLITDGRSSTQRNKINALNILHLFSDIIISEEFGSSKPCSDNYTYFTEKYGRANCFYIGDNIRKDFIAPNQMGWVTIGLLDDGRNIHAQDISEVEDKNLPNCWVSELSEALPIILSKTKVVK
jgi:putative hydrolase of the HAD superfamily